MSSSNHEKSVNDKLQAQEAARQALGAHRAFGVVLPDITTFSVFPKEQTAEEREADKLLYHSMLDNPDSSERLASYGARYDEYSRMAKFDRRVQRIALGIAATGLTLLALDKAAHVDTHVPAAVEVGALVVGANTARNARNATKTDKKRASREVDTGILVYVRHGNGDAQVVPGWISGAMDTEQRERLTEGITEYGNDVQKAQLPLVNPNTKE
ncbi:MAG: hypothetical protein ACREGB_02580 [Candidatus Saccharimonadales bacterium]